MNKIKEMFEKLSTKFTNFVDNICNYKIVKIIMPFVNFFLVCVIFWQFCNCCGFITSDNTAYAYNADSLDTNNYSQLTGLVFATTAGSGVYVLSNTSSSYINIYAQPQDEDVILYGNLPPCVIQEGTQRLEISLPQDTYCTINYSVNTVSQGYDNIIETDGNVDVFAEIEDDIGLPTNIMYRLSFLEIKILIVPDTIGAGGLWAIRIDYTNESVLSYNSWVYQTREFYYVREENLRGSVAPFGQQLVDFSTNLLAIEILPDFRIFDILIIVFGTSLALLIAKLFLGG